MTREEIIRLLSSIQAVAYVDDDGEDRQAKLSRIYTMAGDGVGRMRGDGEKMTARGSSVIRAHARYAGYVIRHKWFVFGAGIKTRAPLWRLLIHDWSKLGPAEWSPYVQMFYGPEPNRWKHAFDIAWLHHQHHNPHHWQHWLLREDSGALKTLPMPQHFVREMVADWMGAGRAITGKWEVAEWYAKNRDTIQLAESTRYDVDTLIARVSA